jgi:hypothetical protein
MFDYFGTNRSKHGGASGCESRTSRQQSRVGKGGVVPSPRRRPGMLPILPWLRGRQWRSGRFLLRPFLRGLVWRSSRALGSLVRDNLLRDRSQPGRETNEGARRRTVRVRACLTYQCLDPDERREKVRCNDCSEDDGDRCGMHGYMQWRMRGKKQKDWFGQCSMSRGKPVHIKDEGFA